jgi:hypothetical protein
MGGLSTLRTIPEPGQPGFFVRIYSLLWVGFTMPEQLALPVTVVGHTSAGSSVVACPARVPYVALRLPPAYPRGSLEHAIPPP